MIILSKLRMPLAKYLFLALLMAISCAIPGILTGIKKWPPQLFATILDASWQNDFYYKAYTRSTPYIYGIIFGYICHQSRNIHRVHGKKLPVWLVILGWLFSTGLCLTTVLYIDVYSFFEYSISINTWFLKIFRYLDYKNIGNGILIVLLPIPNAIAWQLPYFMHLLAD